MTTPVPPQPAVIDPGNALLAETPSNLVTGLVETPQGQRLAVTVRTASTTLTVLLAPADAKAWAAAVSQAAGQMSVSGLIIANGGGVPHG